MPLNLHNFAPRSRANGPGERSVIWVQGCPRSCPGCFNPDSQAFAPRETATVDELGTRIATIEGINGVTFSGGEPFSQAAELAQLAQKIHGLGLTVVCYTGYTLEQLREADRDDWNALLTEIDLLIDGPFIQSKRCNEPYRGSLNQRLHFLSGRIRREDIRESQTAELTLDINGSCTTTGFPDYPDAAEVFAAATGLHPVTRDNSEA